MKVYGADLWGQYKAIEELNESLRNKAKKRMKYILKHSNDPYLDGYRNKDIDNLNTDTMLLVIMKVEENYVNQSTQLDFFDNL